MNKIILDRIQELKDIHQQSLSSDLLSYAQRIESFISMKDADNLICKTKKEIMLHMNCKEHAMKTTINKAIEYGFVTCHKTNSKKLYEVVTPTKYPKPLEI